MKKFLGAILALTLIFSCFALSGCGEVKSDVKGINTNRTTSQASYTAKTDCYSARIRVSKNQRSVRMTANIYI